jgi:hypothetical protein
MPGLELLEALTLQRARHLPPAFVPVDTPTGQTLTMYLRDGWCGHFQDTAATITDEEAGEYLLGAAWPAYRDAGGSGPALADRVGEHVHEALTETWPEYGVALKTLRSETQ